ncbi:alkaline phosphatase family protein [Fodinibius sp.]|uniref:alkaline phosphatase family protein n=1 Tax=Fodinibius sp. TaxID=1872440 RepID=UPI002ACD290C|nr:alkaline phosphatase family protein [Fodinibius sp.]MDZ7660330.1 alkaline phosphatase family protein [Fodinibius sp.]
MSSVIFLFIDGVGLGKATDANPFTQSTYCGFSAMAGDQEFSDKASELTDTNHLFKFVDARLGVDGLPQSGTGQTALFTGKNASKEIGKHFGPFPHSGIKPFLKEDSLFIKAREMEKKCNFINAYPDIFFQKARKRNRWSCTTLMTKSADISLNTTKEVKRGQALTAELTQQAWREHLDIDVPEISPEEAADRLLEQTESYDMLLHEYYLTDKAGHSQDFDKAAHYLKTYDRFLWHLINYKNSDTTLVLCSDHGNVEDLSTKTHTFNKVPLFAYGSEASQFKDAKSIMDVTPGILEILEE